MALLPWFLHITLISTCMHTYRSIFSLIFLFGFMFSSVCLSCIVMSLFSLLFYYSFNDIWCYFFLFVRGLYSVMCGSHQAFWAAFWIVRKKWRPDHIFSGRMTFVRNITRYYVMYINLLFVKCVWESAIVSGFWISSIIGSVTGEF